MPTVYWFDLGCCSQTVMAFKLKLLRTPVFIQQYHDSSIKTARTKEGSFLLLLSIQVCASRELLCSEGYHRALGE